MFSRGTSVDQKMIQLTSQKNAQFIVQVRENMVPDMYVVATHVTKNGAIIADEVHFKVQGLPFRNKVQLNLASSQHKGLGFFILTIRSSDYNIS